MGFEHYVVFYRKPKIAELDQVMRFRGFTIDDSCMTSDGKLTRMYSHIEEAIPPNRFGGSGALLGFNQITFSYTEFKEGYPLYKRKGKDVVARGIFEVEAIGALLWPKKEFKIDLREVKTEDDHYRVNVPGLLGLYETAMELRGRFQASVLNGYIIRRDSEVIPTNSYPVPTW